MEGEIAVVANGNGLGLAVCDLIKDYKGRCSALVDLASEAFYY